MAKRTAKNPVPDDGDKGASFQIPEVPPTQPDPWEEIAASVERIKGEVTAGIPRSKAKPNLSVGMDDYNPDTVHRTRANQAEPTLTMQRPARGRMTVLATDLLGDCAIKNELGNREPTRAVITRSQDRQWFFIMPTHHKADKGVEITYQSKQACINLFGPFQDMGKLVAKGYRQNYYLEMTDEPMTIHGISGYALYFSLADYEEEAISQREEGEAESSAGAKTSSTAKAGSKTATATKAGATPEKSSAGEPSAPATEATGAAPPEAAGAPEEEEDDYVLLVKELNEAVDSRDAKIDEMKAKLKAYEEKLGQL